MKNLWKMSLILLAVCTIAAGRLAFVYKATKSKIEKQAEDEKNISMKEVLPGANRFEEITKDRYWTGYKDKKKLGYVIKTSSMGYGGLIDIIFGVDTENKIVGIKILKHNETPGLGAKIQEPAFLEQFIDSGPLEEISLKKDNPKGRIDAISAATISSRTVTNAVRDALDSFIRRTPK